MKKVTILIPAYNEAASIPLLHAELKRLADTLAPQYAWDFLFVNDGSTDSTLDALRAVRREDSRVSYINLSRNFGKESAMLAGFDHAAGDAVVIMDGDLQHPVGVIPEMLAEWERGAQDVYARRRTRGKEPLLRRVLTRWYYGLLQRSSRFDVLQNVGDFRLLDRRCVDALCQLRECQRYTKGLFCWVGFKKKEITFDQEERHAGESSFTYGRLLGLAVEGLTSYTTAPLRISTATGALVSFAAFAYLLFVVGKTLIFGETVQGYPTLVVLVLLLGGLQLLALGVIGEYVARIFTETKRRPPYLIDTINDEPAR